MSKFFCSVGLVLAIAFPLAFVGCGGPAQNNPGASAGEHDHDRHEAGHEHGEEHAGPHGGHVIDIGRTHSYHAEIVEDAASRSITVYILDKDLKELPIAEKMIAMNLNVDGAAKTFELTAVGEGDSSEFKAADPGLFATLHDKEAAGKLRVTIDGTPYTGEVTRHDHDEHHGHSH